MQAHVQYLVFTTSFPPVELSALGNLHAATQSSPEELSSRLPEDKISHSLFRQAKIWEIAHVLNPKLQWIKAPPPPPS